MIVGLLLTAGLFADSSIWTKLLGVAASTLSALGYTAARSSLKKAAGLPALPTPKE